MEDDENLPANPIPQLPEIPAVGPANHLNEVIAADAFRSEVMLQRMYMELSKDMSIQSLCRLSTAMFKGMETRRHLLNRQYGTANKGKDDGIVDAID